MQIPQFGATVRVAPDVEKNFGKKTAQSVEKGAEKLRKQLAALPDDQVEINITAPLVPFQLVSNEKVTRTFYHDGVPVHAETRREPVKHLLGKHPRLYADIRVKDGDKELSRKSFEAFHAIGLDLGLPKPKVRNFFVNVRNIAQALYQDQPVPKLKFPFSFF